MNYGLPYMGSKSKLCKYLCRIFPKADNFYDLFGGGFSVTHFMIRNRAKDYKEFHFNEIRPKICDLIRDAIGGKYSYDVYQPKWVSREEFFKNKETDPIIKILWSFGNNGEDYLFAKDIEAYKRSMHQAVIFNEFDGEAKKIFGLDKFRDEYSIRDRRFFLRNRQGILKKRGDLEQLERLQQLERLEQLEQLQQLQFYNTSFENVEIKPNSLIYCDIPYAGTAEYDKNFNFNRTRFLDWANEQANPVFISEYRIEDKRFKEIFRMKKRSLLRSDKTMDENIERVYVNQTGQTAVLLTGGR